MLLCPIRKTAPNVTSMNGLPSPGPFREVSNTDQRSTVSVACAPTEKPKTSKKKRVRKVERTGVCLDPEPPVNIPHRNCQLQPVLPCDQVSNRPKNLNSRRFSPSRA